MIMRKKKIIIIIQMKIKKNEEENIPSSDQMRINTIFMNNENNIDNNNIEGSVHISDEGNNNN